MATSINPTVQLAKIRSKIDKEQAIVAQLELELQQAILGGASVNVNGLIDKIKDIYGDVPDGDALIAAIKKELGGFKGKAEQDVIRDQLSRHRALLGELRVEEQQWNQEVTEEKQRRKDLTEFAKG